ncbi:MAG: aminoacyl-tRNA deacylase [Acidobacteria bacterium]|nr:aminoacyl-tRNA deacylase [Acidobacteriota bacterium]MBK8149731.1 aminoacyl-tRNA deacylase [Acidobacteriota bacterium]
MSSFPITPAIRVLREKKIEFEPFLYDYLEKGGTRHSADCLGVDEHAVIKTLIFETNEKKPLIVLQHGDLQVSTKDLARILKIKSVVPATPDRANKLTGYLVGGTSPFGLRTAMPIYTESSIFDLQRIWINGGKRGFLVSIVPAALAEVLGVEAVNVAVRS